MRCGKVQCPAYLLIGRGLASGSETERGLERGHRLPPAIMAKDEFVEINLKLITAHAVISFDQPLLQVVRGLPKAPRTWPLCAARFAGVGIGTLQRFRPVPFPPAQTCCVSPERNPSIESIASS